MSSKTADANKNKKKKKEAAVSAKDKAAKAHGEGAKKRLGGFLFAKMARGGAAELSSNADEVNKLNVFPVPDGDTGDNMRMTIESGIRAIENLNSDNLAEVMRVLSHGMLLGARGNSGVILSQFFAGVAASFENATDADVSALGEALEEGVRRAYGTVSTPTEGTILTVAREAVSYAVSKITPKTTIKSFFGNLVSEMYSSLERTPELLPKLKAAGVVDSGGAGLFYIMDGFRRVLNGEEPAGTKVPNSSETGRDVQSIDGGISELGCCSYCTEALVQLPSSAETDFDTDMLRESLCRLGDSVATVLDDGIVKVHVHTSLPEKVLALVHKYGEFLNIKIENMTLQELNNSAKSEELFTSSEKTRENIQKKYGIVAVCCGEGIGEVFRELGADEVILCGSGASPSAKDFIDRFDMIDAETVFVFPNNANFLLAAKQAADMYKNKKVVVAATQTVGTGYAALAAFDCERHDTGSILDGIYEELSHVRDGYVSIAVRNADIDGIKVKAGYALGIIGKKIVLCKKSLLECAEELACKLLRGKGHLTVFCGAESSAKENRRLAKRIKEKLPGTEIYTAAGGQEIYRYIFVAR